MTPYSKLTIRYYDLSDTLHTLGVTLESTIGRSDIGVLLEAKKASRYMLDFANDICSNAATDVAVVWCDGKPIAFWAVDKSYDTYLHSCGTYVEKQWRRLGIASWLWTCATRKWGLKEISADGVTRAGKAFLRTALGQREVPLVVYANKIRNTRTTITHTRHKQNA